MSESPVVGMEHVPANSFHHHVHVSDSGGTSQKTLAACPPPLTKPRGIYNCVNTLIKWMACAFLLLPPLSVSVAAMTCSIVGCQVTE